jgi:hypothetical protein
MRTIFYILLLFILVIILTPFNGGFIQFIKAFALLMIIMILSLYSWVFTQDDVDIKSLS